MTEYGLDQVISWEYHPDNRPGQDPFNTADQTTRSNWYGVTGYPTIYIDGGNPMIGAYDNCGTMTTTFEGMLDQRIQDTQDLSPVFISSSFDIVGSNVTMSATYKLMDPVILSNLQATLVLYEDGVIGPNDPLGNHIWNGTVRQIYNQSVTLAHQGDQVTVTKTYPITSGWVSANLHGGAILQNTATKEIIQGQMLGRTIPLDYSMAFSKKVRSVPSGNGMAIFPASVTNISGASETLTLEPGTAFGDWTVDYLVCGDSNPHSGQFDITLAANQSCDFQVRVHTNATVEIRNGTFKVTCQSTGHMQETTLRCFNGSPSIRFVDNDGTGKLTEVGMLNGLTYGNYLYDLWSVETNGTTPNYAKLDGYDIVIWNAAANPAATTLSDTDAANLMNFMDQGGAVFLDSNHYLDGLSGAHPTFLTNYLGCASYTVHKAYVQMNGVGGDAVGNGITLPLSFQYPSFAQGDDAVPGATATTDFLAPDGSHAMIRNTMAGGAKAIFMPERFDAISTTDADPNNERTVIHRVIEWLRPATADTPPIDTHLLSGIQQARPNPFSQGTQISFALSPNAAGAPVRLEIYDIGGRMVAQIVNGVLSPGVHLQRWNGRNADGSDAHSGVFFARLTTREGTQSSKLILLK